MRTVVDPHVADALNAVLSAGKPQRFKVLTVACPNDHVLGRVYRTTAGLVLVHDTEGDKATGAGAVVVPGVGDVPLPAIEGPRAERVAYLLEETGRVRLPMQCRCSTHLPKVPLLLAAIAAGKKRHRID